jgi:hypothetical protein
LHPSPNQKSRFTTNDLADNAVKTMHNAQQQQQQQQHHQQPQPTTTKFKSKKTEIFRYFF